MAIALSCPEEMPARARETLGARRAILQERQYLEQVIEDPVLRKLAADLDSVCQAEGVVGYHFTRAERGEIETRGLLARTGGERRRDFLASYGQRFTKPQLQRIQRRWSEYFDSEMNRVRDGRVWFSFTIEPLRDGGAERLLSYYGGEVVFMPLTEDEDEDVAEILRGIGEPLVVECALDAGLLHTFSDAPWGRVWLSSHHVAVNPEAVRFDVDAYQKVSVEPARILSVRAPSAWSSARPVNGTGIATPAPRCSVRLPLGARSMKSVRVVARLVDGGEMDWAFGPEFLTKLGALEARGLSGKGLIHELLTDDWGPPPVTVTISGTGPDGRRLKRTIAYD